MTPIDPGKVTGLQVLGFTALPGPVGPELTEVRCGLQVNGRLVELKPGFTGLQMSPTTRSAFAALIAALETEMVELTGLVTAAQAAQPATRGIGHRG